MLCEGAFYNLAEDLLFFCSLSSDFEVLGVMVVLWLMTEKIPTFPQ